MFSKPMYVRYQNDLSSDSQINGVFYVTITCTTLLLPYFDLILDKSLQTTINHTNQMLCETKEPQNSHLYIG